MRPCASAKPNDHKVFVNGYLRKKYTLSQTFDDKHLIGQIVSSQYWNAIEYNRSNLKNIIGDKISSIKYSESTDVILLMKQSSSQVVDLIKRL